MREIRVEKDRSRHIRLKDNEVNTEVTIKSTGAWQKRRLGSRLTVGSAHALIHTLSPLTPIHAPSARDWSLRPLKMHEYNLQQVVSELVPVTDGGHVVHQYVPLALVLP